MDAIWFNKIVALKIPASDTSESFGSLSSTIFLMKVWESWWFEPTKRIWNLLRNLVSRLKHAAWLKSATIQSFVERPRRALLNIWRWQTSTSAKNHWVTMIQRSTFPFLETKFKVHVTLQPVRFGLRTLPKQRRPPWALAHPPSNGDRWPVLSKALCSEANEGLGSPQHWKTINWSLQ